ncbi:hypothetical protein BJV82DRAFT_665243 [Fennellomyces sp. T-0311]|nr:hypothetical protein BJV82DRAFT_665243 [Fennellomyces sp. T-0311]
MSTRPRRHAATLTKKKLVKQLGHPRRKRRVTKKHDVCRRPCQTRSRRLNLRSSPLCDVCHGACPAGSTISMYAKEKDTWYRLCLDCRRVYAASEQDAYKTPESDTVSKLKSFLRTITRITGHFLSTNG